MPHYAVIACEAMTRALEHARAKSDAHFTVEMVDLGLHSRPKKLRTHLQVLIDSLAPEKFDAILMLFGVCGKATMLTAPEGLPIILPRAHDCITLYLGSASKFYDEFTREPGTYWYSVDYMTRAKETHEMLGASTMGMDPEEFERLVDKYGLESATYIRDTMTDWKTHYSRAVFIDDGFGGEEALRAEVKEKAETEGWTYQEMRGSNRLVEMMLRGEWPEDEFLVVQPGEYVALDGAGGIVKAVR